MGFKIVFEQEDDDSCEEYPCPKCGEDCEPDDNYCCDCGTKLSGPPVATRAAALKPMKSLIKGQAPAQGEMD
jgi:predicted amidophosphoribosyltransferase